MANRPRKRHLAAEHRIRGTGGDYHTACGLGIWYGTRITSTNRLVWYPRDRPLECVSSVAKVDCRSCLVRIAIGLDEAVTNLDPRFWETISREVHDRRGGVVVPRSRLDSLAELLERGLIATDVDWRKPRSADVAYVFELVAAMRVILRGPA